METPVQQQEYANGTVGLEQAQSKREAALSPNYSTNYEVQKIVNQVSSFFAELPEYIGRFYQQYKLAITTLGLFLGAIVTLKVFLAVLDALNDIPLFAPFFELVGIGYVAWFTKRYLLQAQTRKELASEFHSLKEEVLGSNIS